LLQKYIPTHVLVGCSPKEQTYVYVQLLIPVRQRKFGLKKFRFNQLIPTFYTNIRNDSTFWESIKQKKEKRREEQRQQDEEDEVKEEEEEKQNEKIEKSQVAGKNDKQEEVGKTEEGLTIIVIEKKAVLNQVMWPQVEKYSERDDLLDRIANMENKLAKHKQFIDRISVDTELLKESLDRATGDNKRLREGLAKANAELAELRSFRDKTSKFLDTHEKLKEPSF
jgi:hypothetical protein